MVDLFRFNKVRHRDRDRDRHGASERLASPGVQWRGWLPNGRDFPPTPVRHPGAKNAGWEVLRKKMRLSRPSLGLGSIMCRRITQGHAVSPTVFLISPFQSIVRWMTPYSIHAHNIPYTDSVTSAAILDLAISNR